MRSSLRHTTAGQALAAQEIEESALRYATDETSLEDHEAEVEFWLAVEKCDRCGPGTQLCTHHFDRFYGGW